MEELPGLAGRACRIAEVAISGYVPEDLPTFCIASKIATIRFNISVPPGKSQLKDRTALASSTPYRFASTSLRHDAPFPTLPQGEHPMIVRILIGVLTMATTLATATVASAHDESQYPDWSGQWRWNAMGGGPRYDPSKPAGAAQQAPLKEEFKRIHEENMAEQAQGGQGLYTQSAKCIPMGMPFQMSIVPFPLEFIITAKTTFILFEVMTSQPRRVYTDGRDFPQDHPPTYPGYSIGKWLDTDGDGRFDTLEVETRNLRVPRLFDQTGIMFHPDGQAIIKERIYQDKTNPNLLHDEMTTIDNALTRPWSVKKSYTRLPTVMWTENNCTEDLNDVFIGKEHYMLGADGNLMPIKKDQPPPDLRHFNIKK